MDKVYGVGFGDLKNVIIAIIMGNYLEMFILSKCGSPMEVYRKYSVGLTKSSFPFLQTF